MGSAQGVWQQKILDMKNANQLRTEWGVRAHGARHDAEQPALRQGNNGPQQLFRLPGGECNHGVADNRDAPAVGETAGDFVAVNESHCAMD